MRSLEENNVGIFDIRFVLVRCNFDRLINLLFFTSNNLFATASDQKTQNKKLTWSKYGRLGINSLSGGVLSGTFSCIFCSGESSRDRGRAFTTFLLAVRFLSNLQDRLKPDFLFFSLSSRFIASAWRMRLAARIVSCFVNVAEDMMMYGKNEETRKRNFTC